MGSAVDLGRVGLPTTKADMRLLHTLLHDRFVPVVASIGVDGEGRLLNVNADTMAGHVAGSLRARRLIIAGSTAGVLDDVGPDGRRCSIRPRSDGWSRAERPPPG